MSTIISHFQNDFTHGEWAPKFLSRTDLDDFRRAARQLTNFHVLSSGAAQTRFGLDKTDPSFADIPVGTPMVFKNFKLDKDNKFILIFWAFNLRIIRKNVDNSLDPVFVTLPTPYPESIIANNQLITTSSQNQLVVTSGDYAIYELKYTYNSITEWEFLPKVFSTTGAFDFKENYDNLTFTLNNVTVGQARTLTVSSPIFSNEYVGGYFEALGNLVAGSGLGYANIVGYLSPTQVVVDIESEFNSSLLTGLIGKDAVLTQSAWTSNSGFPTVCVFHQQRLFVASTRSLPLILWGSEVGKSRSFDLSTGAPDKAISVTLDGNEQDVLQHIISAQDLIFFSDTAILAAIALPGEPFTNSNFDARIQTNGKIGRLQPILFDNQIIYTRKSGNALYTAIFDDAVNKYRSPCVSLYASHLIKNPLAWATVESSDQIEDDFLYLVNEDGTLTIWQTILSERVTAFTSANTGTLETPAQFKNVITVDETTYFLVERTINGVPEHALEAVNFNGVLDAASYFSFGLPTGTLTGLEAYANTKVSVILDGWVFNEQLVSESGTLTFDRVFSEAIVGYPFTCTLQPMPYAPDTEQGTTLDKRKQTPVIYIDFVDSLGIRLNGELINDFQLSPDNLMIAPTPKSGLAKISGFGSWEYRFSPVITVSDPYKATIRGVGWDIRV